MWGWSFGDQSTVTVHVRRLREKVETDPTNPTRLRHGLGRGLPLGGQQAMSDLTEIWVVAIGSGAGRRPPGTRWRAGRLRHRSLRWQLAVVGVVTTLTVLVGVQAISRRMLISDHDRSVVLIVTSAAAVVSLVVALVLATALVRWSRSLRDDVRRVGAGDAVVAATARAPPSSRSSPSELAAANQRLAEARDRERGSRSRGASWSPGSPTTCARRWPGSG